MRLADGGVAYLQEAAVRVEGGAVEPINPGEAGFPTIEATVKVFELKAHERANADSPVTSTFTEGTKLQVAAERQHGWRRARLTDGSTAFVEERGRTLPLQPAAAARQGMTTRTTPPRRPDRPEARKIYVKDLDHLATLVQSDPKVYPLARRMATNRTAGFATMLVSGVGGAVLWIGSLTFLGRTTTASTTPARSNPISPPSSSGPVP